MKQIGKYTFFWKDKIAQWNMQSFKENDIEFCCAEQYMMYKKALLFKDFEIAEKILKSKNPSEIQKLGRIVKNFIPEIWDSNKEEIVYKGNVLKFEQNENLKEILLNTGDTILVEASPYDLIYGIGLGVEDPNITDESKWRGLNLLGKILMRVREFLKGEIK